MSLVITLNHPPRNPLTLCSHPSPPTHRAGNQLNLIFTRSCGTSALSVTPLPVSDHHFVDFSIPLKSSPPLLSSSHIVTTRRNLKSLSPSTFASTVLFSLPSIERFSQLYTDESSDTLLSSLSSSFDSLCSDLHRPCLGCPFLCGLVEQSCEQLRGNGRDQTVLMIYLTIFSFFQISPLVCQQPNLPPTGTKSTPLPQTPGNCFPCSRPSSTLPHPTSFLPHC